MISVRPNQALYLVASLLCLGVSHYSFAQALNQPDEEPVIATKEYFVDQQAGEALVVRVSAIEAQFVSRLWTETEGVIAVSALPGVVTPPVYHFVPNADATRQVNINVAATQVSNRTEFELQLTRLNMRDERSIEVASAYHLLAAGMEVLPSGNIPETTVRIQTLFRAASVFEEIGMQEMRLWSRISGVHLILEQLNDYQTTIDFADELLNEPRISRYPEIEFMALELKSTAMAEGRIGAGGSDPLNSPLQEALAATIAAAKSLDRRLEEAMALMAAGVDLIDHGRHRQAQGFLDSALVIAEEIEAGDLAAAIREQMVEVHSQVGELDTSGEILEDIETHLLEEGEEQELAVNLIRQGRVHAESYRYAQAIQVLSRAVELEQGDLSRLEAEIDLGLALSASGDEETALYHLYRAVRNPENGTFRRPSNVLKIRSALYEIAAIHRHLEQWEQLQEIREVIEGSLDSPARHAFFAHQRAIDSLRRRGTASPLTLERYSRAFLLADGAGQAELRNLARLGMCALPEVTSQDPRCQPGELRNAFRAMQRATIPARTAESGLFFARILDQSGQADEAFGVSDDLIETLTASGYAPLGSWYWQWRDLLTGDYLDYALKTEEGRYDASTSLLALLKARLLDRGGATGPVFSERDLQSLLRGLPGDSVILSYLLSESDAIAWVGGRGGVQHFSLPGGERAGYLSQEIRQILGSGDVREFDRLARELGAILLDPIAPNLKNNIYLVNHAPLVGIPFDALVFDGNPVAVRHSLSHLELLPGARDRARNDFQPPETVFLGGDPRDWSGEFASRLETSAEVKAVNDFFVGPGLHTVQGVSLLRDEFTDPRYGQADLIHLAVPGIVNLAPGQDSNLFLSEPTRGEGRELMDSETLATTPLTASLVFLSRTEFKGSASALENRTGVVSAMLDAGARAVIASLWTVEPDFRRRFVSDFYSRLANEENIMAALAGTKRDSIASGELRDWASFQLFLN